MDLEWEWGIIIKFQVVCMNYKVKDGQDYVFNLIDILGYVDFFYEVFCFLVVCEGVLLVVDVFQGVEVQMLVNVYLVLDNNLEIIFVLNKIDFFSVELDWVVVEIEEVVGFDCSDII